MEARLWSNHVLHALLLPLSAVSQRYNLRQRAHSLQLPEHKTQLSDCTFLTRMLYKNTYWLQFSCILLLACVMSCLSINEFDWLIDWLIDWTPTPMCRCKKNGRTSDTSWDYENDVKWLCPMTGINLYSSLKFPYTTNKVLELNEWISLSLPKVYHSPNSDYLNFKPTENFPTIKKY